MPSKTAHTWCKFIAGRVARVIYLVLDSPVCRVCGECRLRQAMMKIVHIHATAATFSSVGTGWSLAPNHARKPTAGATARIRRRRAMRHKIP